jgi:hypothetical protein
MKYTYLVLFIILSFNFSCIKDNRPGNISISDELPSGYKICFIGDTGTGKQDQYKVADLLYQERCDQVRILGDLVYQAGLFHPGDEQFLDKFYKPYQKLIEEQKVPFFITLGNHDYGSNPGSWLGISSMYEQIFFPSFYYANIYDDICIINLDTNANFSRQERWLKSSVVQKTFSDCKLKIYLGHHPYLSVGSHGDSSGKVKRFLKNTVIGKSNAYFSGHDHNLSDEGELEGTRLLVSGSGAKLRSLSREPRVWAESKLGYFTLVVYRKENSFKVVYRFKTIGKDGKPEKIHRGSIIPSNLK